MTSKSNLPAYRKFFETLKGQETGYTMEEHGAHLFVSAVASYGGEGNIPKRTRALMDAWVGQDPKRIAARKEWRKVLNGAGFATVGGVQLPENKRLSSITFKSLDPAKRGTGHKPFSSTPRPTVKTPIAKTPTDKKAATQSKEKLAAAVTKALGEKVDIEPKGKGASDEVKAGRTGTEVTSLSSISDKLQSDEQKKDGQADDMPLGASSGAPEESVKGVGESIHENGERSSVDAADAQASKESDKADAEGGDKVVVV